MALSASQLGKEILTALKNTFATKWPDIEEYGEAESKKMVQALLMIEALKVSGKINEEQAKLHFDIQKNASRTVLLTIEGLGVLTVEAALDSALESVKDAVNGALGFTLL